MYMYMYTMYCTYTCTCSSYYWAMYDNCDYVWVMGMISVFIFIFFNITIYTSNSYNSYLSSVALLLTFSILF